MMIIISWFSQQWDHENIFVLRYFLLTVIICRRSILMSTSFCWKKFTPILEKRKKPKKGWFQLYSSKLTCLTLILYSSSTDDQLSKDAFNSGISIRISNVVPLSHFRVLFCFLFGLFISIAMGFTISNFVCLYLFHLFYSKTYWICSHTSIMTS